MTPQDLARLVQTGQISPDQLNGMDHATLYQAREYAPQQFQGILAGPEHRAFAREATAENPLMALPIALATPLYQGYKALNGSRSPPSMDQVTGGLAGVGEGLSQRLRGLLNR